MKKTKAKLKKKLFKFKCGCERYFYRAQYCNKYKDECKCIKHEHKLSPEQWTKEVINERMELPKYKYTKEDFKQDLWMYLGGAIAFYFTVLQGMGIVKSLVSFIK